MLESDCLEIQATCIMATPSLSLSITFGLTFNCSRLITSSSLPIPPTISSSSSLSLTWSLSLSLSLSLIIDLQCSALNLKIWVNIYMFFLLLLLVLHAMYNKLNFCFCLFWCYLHFSKWVFFGIRV